MSIENGSINYIDTKKLSLGALEIARKAHGLVRSACLQKLGDSKTCLVVTRNREVLEITRGEEDSSIYITPTKDNKTTSYSVRDFVNREEIVFKTSRQRLPYPHEIRVTTIASETARKMAKAIEKGRIL